MKLNDFLTQVNLPHYSNNFANGKHKNGNYKNTWIKLTFEDKGYCYYNLNTIVDQKYASWTQEILNGNIISIEAKNNRIEIYLGGIKW